MEAVPPEELVPRRVLIEEMLELCRACARARLNIVIGAASGAGGTAAALADASGAVQSAAFSFIQATSPRDAIRRMEAMAAAAEPGMDLRALRLKVAAAVDLIAQVARLSDGTLRVTYLTECVGVEKNNQIALQDIFVFEKTGRTEAGRFQGRFRATGIRPRFWLRLHECGIELPRSILEANVTVE
jgi:pilus assembly protein CpaF